MADVHNPSIRLQNTIQIKEKNTKPKMQAEVKVCLSVVEYNIKIKQL